MIRSLDPMSAGTLDFLIRMVRKQEQGRLLSERSRNTASLFRPPTSWKDLSIL